MCWKKVSANSKFCILKEYIYFQNEGEIEIFETSKHWARLLQEFLRIYFKQKKKALVENEERRK